MQKMPLSGFLIAGGILTALYLYRASKGSPGGLLAPHGAVTAGPAMSDFGHPGVFAPVEQPEGYLSVAPVAIGPQGANPGGSDPWNVWASEHPGFFEKWQGPPMIGR
jgi:hypothetical protein